MAIIVTTNESSPAAPETKLAETNSEVNKENSESAHGNEQDETAEASEALESEESEEQSDESEDEHDEEKSQQDEKPKKKGGFKKRIERFQRKLSVAEQEVAYWKEQALKGNSKPEPETTKAHAKEESNDEPQEQDFETFKEYQKALIKYELSQEKKESDKKARESQVKSDYQKQVEKFQSKVSEFAKTKDDFEDVISEVDDVPLSHAVQESITSSENGPELMYELAKNKKELMRINALSPILAAREIGKIEARLAKTETKPIPKTTKAPAPIAPVGSNGSAKPKKSITDPNLTQSEYEQLRREQMKKNRGY
ncbi:MAG: hypothetical protein ACXVCP_00355 [Bdellovibrio sp.]